MERVKKGEVYWYVFLGDFNPCALLDREDDSMSANARYDNHNYFHTEEEAEAVAEKIRKVLKGAWVITPPEGEIFSRKVEAVLNGADVIEMPSEEEVKDKAICIAKNICGDDYWRDCEEAVIRTTFWLKSKIVK